MIKKLTIQNFRSHRHVVLDNCGQVSILLGRNNTGKTAILEAILLLCFPPNAQDVITLLNDQRGYKPGNENYELWDSYFNHWDHSQTILLSAEEESDHSNFNQGICQSLTITPLIGSPNPVTSGSVIEGQDMQETTQGLGFRYQYKNGPIERQVTTLKREIPPPATLPLEGRKIPVRRSPIAFIPSKGIANPQDEAERFSRLEKANRQQEVEESLRAVEPRLKRLTVLASGQSSMVYGDLGEGPLIPVALMGEGMVRMLSIATAMANNKGGIVLVDEIENGLHYSVLPSLWKMIFKTAQALHVQVFAATHSDECLQAASQVAQAQTHSDALRIFRLNLRSGKTIVTDYNADELAAAIDSDQEVR